MQAHEKTYTLLPVYLINGEDELKRQTVLKRLKGRIEEQGDLAFNYDVFNGESAVGQEIVTACNTLPFASEVRLVQVDNVDKLKKADAEALITYLEQPATTTVLALIADKLAKNTRLYKAVLAQGKQTLIDCVPQKRYELVRTLRSLAVGHGITLTEGAAQALVDRVGENTVFLDNELKKIALAHQGDGTVNEQEVSLLVHRSAEIKPWEFVDAFAGRSITKALICLKRVTTSPHALLAMCVTRLRELICARALMERGCTHDIPKVLKMPDWRVKNHKTWAQNFTAQELREALSSARDAERMMKSGSDPHDVFLEWALKVMTKENKPFRA